MYCLFLNVGPTFSTLTATSINKIHECYIFGFCIFIVEALLMMKAVSVLCCCVLFCFLPAFALSPSFSSDPAVEEASLLQRTLCLTQFAWRGDRLHRTFPRRLSLLSSSDHIADIFEHLSLLEDVLGTVFFKLLTFFGFLCYWYISLSDRSAGLFFFFFSSRSGCTTQDMR